MPSPNSKRRATTVWSSFQQTMFKHGVRSGLEKSNQDLLQQLCVAFGYETHYVPYTIPAREAKYKPDFLLLANGIIVETKGRFMAADRKKHLLIKEQHPNLEIRFVFYNPASKLSKKSATTYGMWATKAGFIWSAKLIPEAWTTEAPNPKWLEAQAILTPVKGPKK